MTTPALVGIDWGTTRFRAYLIDDRGVVIDQVQSDDGLMAVKPGGFPAVLALRCGMWLARAPYIPILMAGMVGSRNGWTEAPYCPCPASVATLRAGFKPIDIGNGRLAHIIPGLSLRDGEGVADVLRGEETLACGAEIENGLVILPGTHSKWITIEKGVMTSFATFMTGDFYAALSGHTILKALRQEPDDSRGFAKGLGAAKRAGGLTHQAFAARTSVLFGDLAGEEVGPYLSGLLIGSELNHGFSHFPDPQSVTLIAEGILAHHYQTALESAQCRFTVIAPETAFIRGLHHLRQSGTHAS